MANEMEALGSLTEEQKATINDWMEDGKSQRDIVASAAKAPPEGLGVTISKSAVDRYQKKLRRERLREAMSEEEALARELLEKTGSGSVDFGEATLRILHQKVFNAALESKGDASCEILRKLTEMKQRQEQLALAEKNYELAKIRFQMNTTRELMKKAGTYIKLYQHQGIDDEAERRERLLCER